MVVGAKASLLVNDRPGHPLALRVVIAIDDAPDGSEPYLYRDAEIAESQLETKKLRTAIRELLEGLGELLFDAGCSEDFLDGVGQVDVVDHTDRTINRHELDPADYPDLAVDEAQLRRKVVLYGPGGGVIT